MQFGWGVLSREEALIRHPSSVNGTSGITEMLAGVAVENKQATASSDSNFDIDGADDCVGSVSSIENRRNQLMDTEESDNLLSDFVQDKDQFEIRSTMVHMNQMEAEVDGLQIHGNEQGNEIDSVHR